MKRLLFLMTLTVVLISSCKKDSNEPIESVIGQWDWVTSAGGVGPQVITPASTGTTRTLTLSSDSTYAFREDGTVYDAGSFHIGQQSDPNKSIKDDVITFKPGRANGTPFTNHITLENDTLSISTLFTWEGGVSKYLRKK